jgi:putative DNA primase/helicase
LDTKFPPKKAVRSNGSIKRSSARQVAPLPPWISAAEVARLDTWMVEIAMEALGQCRETTGGSWRVGEKDCLSIHPGGAFHDFRKGTGGRGGLALIKHLHEDDDAGAVARADNWLQRNEGVGRLATSVSEDEGSAAALDDMSRTAEINDVWNRAEPIAGTPAEVYLNSRGLKPSADDVAQLRWLAHIRGEEGVMIAALRDNESNIVAILMTFITAEGEKSEIQPIRQLHRGPHDWNRRGLVRFGKSGPSMVVCEGVEDALSARAGGADYAVAIGGIARLGKSRVPADVEKVVVVRDDDPVGSSAELSLWRGLTRLLGQDVTVLVTPRLSNVAGPNAPPIKDINNLLQRDPTAVEELLAAANIKPVRLSEEAASNIVDEASRLDRNAYEKGRKRIADLLGWSRVKALDDACRSRIEERIMTGGQATRPPEEEPWDDPIMDIGAVLDETVAEMSRYVVASLHHHHSVALWSVWAHLLHREDLGVVISPRLAIQSPTKRCGKTTYLKIVTCLVPRPQPTGSLTPSSLFRAVDARKVTLLIDEADNLFHRNANPDLFAIFNSGHDRVMSKVIRSVPDGSGGYEDHEFQSFTGIAITSIRQLPDTAQDRCIALRIKRATPAEQPEHLVNGRSSLLIDCRRKIARWVADLRELPKIERPPSLYNRVGDNWYGLLQVAELAGGDWPDRALRAALASDADGEDPDELVALLADIWQIFHSHGVVRMHTVDLVDALREVDEGRWKAVNHGKGVDAYYLRETLKDVLPKTEEAERAREWRGGGRLRKGYGEIHLQDAWRRYLSKEPPSSAKAPSRSSTKREDSKTSATSATSGTMSETRDSSMTCSVADAEVAIRDTPGIRDISHDAPDCRGSQDHARQASPTEITRSDQAPVSNVADVADVADGCRDLQASIPRGARGRRSKGDRQEVWA